MSRDSRRRLRTTIEYDNCSLKQPFSFSIFHYLYQLKVWKDALYVRFMFDAWVCPDDDEDGGHRIILDSFSAGNLEANETRKGQKPIGLIYFGGEERRKMQLPILCAPRIPTPFVEEKHTHTHTLKHHQPWQGYKNSSTKIPTTEIKQNLSSESKLKKEFLL